MLLPILLGLAAFLSLTGIAWGAYTFFAAEPAAPQIVSQTKVLPVVSSIGSLAAPPEGAERDALRRTLIQAGYGHPRAMEFYLLIRALAALLLPLLAMATQSRSIANLVLGLVLALIGYYLPFLVIYFQRKKRHTDIRNALPNALDMLVSCLEAGLGLDMALHHVADELKMAAPLLSLELSYVNNELLAGIPHADALRHLDTRTGLPELTSLVNLLSQAERYGIGISASLRSHAQLIQRRRLLDAERRAAEATPKLTVVMILFILPPLFVVLLGPAVVNVVAFLLPSLQEGAR